MANDYKCNFNRFYQQDSPFSRKAPFFADPDCKEEVDFFTIRGFGNTPENTSLRLLEEIQSAIAKSHKREFISVLDISLPEESEYGFEAKALMLVKEVKKLESEESQND